MRQVWKATVSAWDEEYDGIWFDSSLYTREAAEAEMSNFIRCDDYGRPYTCYVYEDNEYSELEYLGELEADDMLMSDIQITA